MLQEASNTPAAAAATQAATPAPMDQIIGGVVADTNAAALKEMGISSLLNNMVASPGEFAVTWVVVVTLVVMSIACWYYTVVIDPNSDLRRAMGVNNVPHTFLLNGAGEVVWQANKYVPGEEEVLVAEVRKLK